MTIMALALAGAMALGGAAEAREGHARNGSCGYSTDYDVHVQQDGIDFRRDAGKPSDVFIHDGHLRVDGSEVAVSANDATRLRAYESQVRSALPEVTAIAREGVNIGYAAMRTVLMTFARNDSERQDLVARLDGNHRDALKRIDDNLGKGMWRQHDVEDLFESNIGPAVSELAGKIAGEAVTAALSGDQSKVAALEARASSLDKSIDREVNSRADQLDKQADALCLRFGALDQLQQQFQFRLQDGSRLQLLKRDNKDNKKLVTAKDPVRAG